MLQVFPGFNTLLSQLLGSQKAESLLVGRGPVLFWPNLAQGRWWLRLFASD